MLGFLERFAQPVGRRLRLRLAGDDVSALIERRDRRRLRWLAQESDDPVIRFRALRSLAEVLDPEAADLFVALLNARPGSEPTAIVRTAAEGLGRLLFGDAGPALRRALAADRPATVQLAAARALASLGRDADWGAVRIWSSRADTEQPLVPDERDCVVPSHREPAGTTPVVWVLEMLYADKESRWWTSTATRWLEGGEASPRLSSKPGADRIVAQEHRHTLAKGDLSDRDFRRIVLHLGSLGRERDHDLLVGLIRAQTDVDRRRTAIQALGLHGDRRSLPMVRAWFGEVPPSRPDVAADLARAAGRLGWPELAADLARLRGSFDQAEVRLEIAWALGESGGAVAVRTLLELVRSREERLPPDELVWVARALKRCGVAGREAIRGSLAIARAGGGERERLRRLAELTQLR